MRSVLKLFRWTGTDIYVHSNGLAGFVGFVKQSQYADLIGPSGLGRGEKGSRQHWVFEVAWNMFVFKDVMLNYLFEVFEGGVGGVLRTSAYFEVELFGHALIFDTIFNVARALINANEVGLDCMELAPMLDEIDAIAQSTIDDPIFIVNDSVAILMRVSCFSARIGVTSSTSGLLSKTRGKGGTSIGEPPTIRASVALCVMRCLYLSRKRILSLTTRNL